MQSIVEHPYMSKWYFFFLSFHRRNHILFIKVSILVTIQLHFSKLHFPGEMFFSLEVTDPFPFFFSAGISRWQEKHLHCAEKHLWPPRTPGPTQKALEGVKLVSSSSIFPARCSTPGCRVSPQQLMTAKHLHGSCCASPSDRGCQSIAVCWGTVLLLTQLCSAGHFVKRRIARWH